MLYAYAATTPKAVPPRVTGIDDHAIELLRVGRLAVAVSRHDSRPEPTAMHVASHHRVTMALVQEGGAIPFRFGNAFEDEKNLRRQLEPRRRELTAKLAQLAGCVEMVLRIGNSKFEIRNSTFLTGTQYLKTKKDQAEAEQRLKDEIGSVAKEWRRSQHGAEVRLACLIPAEFVSQLRERARGATITGPWPPSSFV